MISLAAAIYVADSHTASYSQSSRLALITAIGAEPGGAWRGLERGPGRLLRGAREIIPLREFLLCNQTTLNILIFS